MPSTSTSAVEARLRRLAHRHGFILRKSRTRNLSVHDRGGYMLADASTNSIVAGENFDLDLADVETRLLDE